MYDIIGLLVRYLQSHNLPGLVNDVNSIGKEDHVYKLQSYNFIYNSAIFTQLDKEALQYLYSLLSDGYFKDYCTCVSLNQLHVHHVVIDVDFKKAAHEINTKPEYVTNFYQTLLRVLNIVLGEVLELEPEQLKIMMFVKLKVCEKRQQINDHEVDTVYAKHGIHFEIRGCVLYRGDNVWLIETLRRYLKRDYPNIDSILDSPTNWCLPFSKKPTKEMYLPVREYTLANNATITYECAQVHHPFLQFVQDFCIVKHYSPPKLYFPLTVTNISSTSALHFGFIRGEGGRGEKIVFKSTKVVKIGGKGDGGDVEGLVCVHRKSLPHINYAITRFHTTNSMTYCIDNSEFDDHICPFTIDYIKREMVSHLRSWQLTRDQNSLAIFNLYIFLVSLYDKIKSTEQRFADVLLDEDGNDNNGHLQNTRNIENIDQLVNETYNKWMESRNNDENVRNINPILFLKCLLVQTYSDREKCRLVYDDSTNNWIYVSRHVLDMVENRTLAVLDFISLMYPMFSLQRDGTIIYYERNRWTTARHKLEHMFLPLKVLDRYKHLLKDESEEDLDCEGQNRNKSKKRKTGEHQQKLYLYTHLIKFWGRVDILEFPCNVISFNDGFVLIKKDYIFFHHTPMFRGQPSNLNWNMLNPIIHHVNSTHCTYPDVLQMLNPSVEYPYSTSTREGGEIIDYFRYSYKKENWPTLDVQTVTPCKAAIGDYCPVYETLKYMLTLFSGDVELVFYLLWTLRYTLLGISIKKVLIFYGAGNNGKSTFSNVLRVLYGSSMSFLSQETIGGKVGSTLCPDLYQAKRAKIVYTDDLNKISPASLKQLVSGAYIYIRTLYNAGESIQMKALVTGSANSLQFAVDFATMKRLFIIPFTNYFSDNTNYYCNNSMYETLATNMLGTIFWLERFADDTNIFYNDELNIHCPPKSVRYYSHLAVWKNDVTHSFMSAYNLTEYPGAFILVDDLICEINLMKGTRSSKFHINPFFNNDVDAIVNLLKHRYGTGKVLNKTENRYEDAIIGVTTEKYKLLYDRTYEMI